MSELLPCPFCGSKEIDPEGWGSGDGRHGPACDGCMASAMSVEQWNTRGDEAREREAYIAGFRRACEVDECDLSDHRTVSEVFDEWKRGNGK